MCRRSFWRLVRTCWSAHGIGPFELMLLDVPAVDIFADLSADTAAMIATNGVILFWCLGHATATGVGLNKLHNESPTDDCEATTMRCADLFRYARCYTSVI